VSLQVVYTPGPHSWGIRGVASDVFVDPLSLDDGHLIVPIITDSTYAGIPLEYAGLYHGGSAGGAARNRDVWFDNVSMSVEDSQLDAIPEPLTFCGALLGIGAVGGRVRRRLRRA
jgi:hypothetical protein